MDLNNSDFQHLRPLCKDDESFRQLIDYLLSVRADVSTDEEVLDLDTTLLLDEVYNYFIETTQDMVTILAPDGTRLYTNPAYEKVTGYSFADLQSLGADDLIHPDDLDHVVNTYRQVLKGQRASQMEYRGRKKNGEYFWIESDVLPICSPSEILTNILSISRDITARKYESQQQFQTLVENNPDRILRISRDGRFLYANPAMATTWGTPAEAIIGKTNEELGVQDPLLEQFRQAREKVFETGKETSIEFPFGEPGEEHIFQSRFIPEFDQHGTVETILAISRDITDFRHTEESLRNSEARANALLDAIPDLVFRLSRDAEYLDFHGDTGDLRINAHRLIGTQIKAHFGVKLHNTFVDTIANVLESAKPVSIEYEIERNGRIDLHEARLVPADRDEVIAIVRDITQERQSQQQDFQIRIEQERSALLSQFIQMASHEFRTPLSVITTNLHILAKSDDESRRQERIERINTQIQLLNKLLEIQLLMSKLDSGLSMRCTDVLIRHIIEPILASKVDRLPGTGIDFQVTIEPDDLICRGDSEYLKQALEQLIDNAIRYSNGEHLVMIRAFQSDNHVTIEVEDKGSGISDDDLPHIFERFWRKDKAQTSAGFGLGLPLAQKIIELHDGRIEVETTPGEGSLFRIVLPA